MGSTVFLRIFSIFFLNLSHFIFILIAFFFLIYFQRFSIGVLKLQTAHLDETTRNAAQQQLLKVWSFCSVSLSLLIRAREREEESNGSIPPCESACAVCGLCLRYVHRYIFISILCSAKRFSKLALC